MSFCWLPVSLDQRPNTNEGQSRPEMHISQTEKVPSEIWASNQLKVLRSTELKCEAASTIRTRSLILLLQKGLSES